MNENRFFSLTDYENAETYEDVKDNIGLVLYSKENAVLEESRANAIFVRENLPGNIVMFLEIIMQDENGGFYHVPISTEQVVDEVLDIEEMFEDGMKCMSEKLPPIFKKTTEHLKMNVMFEDPQFYILHTDSPFGASSIMYPGVKEMIGDKLGCDYFVVPSTIDWCVIAPDDGTKDLQTLQNALIEQNKNLKNKEWKLSDEVLYYRRSDNKFMTAYEAKNGSVIYFSEITSDYMN